VANALIELRKRIETKQKAIIAALKRSSDNLEADAATIAGVIPNMSNNEVKVTHMPYLRYHLLTVL
jgi:hypothetical protein